MNLVDDNGGIKIFTRRNSRRTYILKLSIVFLFVFVALCVFILPDKLIQTSINIKQLVLNPLPLSSKRQLLTDRKHHLILLWTSYFGKQNWLPSTKELQCPVDNCNVTSDRIHLNHSSAVVLHWRNIKPDDLPVCPFSNEQTSSCPFLVLFNKEAPPHTSADALWKLDDKIHWTATYRKDSDIKAPYGKVISRTKVAEMPEISLNRSSVCWLVSNCQAPSNREKYVDDLNNSISVEVYGRCGKYSCPYEKTIDCYKWLSHRCRFYLSFENSVCKDYSTEKLYYALMSGMVPVVLGGDNYAEHLPPHSFIDVRDYSSPKDLANYLLELTVNDAKFLSYFQWRRKYFIQDGAYKWLCGLCEKLNTNVVGQVKPHNSVVDWWYKYPCDIIYY
ncbi:4-galactosyl-N-acetylglucosaminide 3-alpha-L-fucosyltransferase 9 isoform X2 [Parasteatoda tepidariorum]|uniref:4-galactosyl-N-acetylglucosaminide 3-alpha-L-fucosyltransferase 9 isoform X2 n=1 Tax=Parasteatoda tepidariorum TaxID=114398 RepID=UPI00077FCEF4|nr:4-galactosyl-N-acetylglucosaminide 3-alpha-L-fucosyltransferase 9-like isoform X2 [Parasteatoda tepidariorum]